MARLITFVLAIGLVGGVIGLVTQPGNSEAHGDAMSLVAVCVVLLIPFGCLSFVEGSRGPNVTIVEVNRGGGSSGDGGNKPNISPSDLNHAYRQGFDDNAKFREREIAAQERERAEQDRRAKWEAEERRREQENNRRRLSSGYYGNQQQQQQQPVVKALNGQDKERVHKALKSGIRIVVSNSGSGRNKEMLLPNGRLLPLAKITDFTPAMLEYMETLQARIESKLTHALPPSTPNRAATAIPDYKREERLQRPAIRPNVVVTPAPAPRVNPQLTTGGNNSNSSTAQPLQAYPPYPGLGKEAGYWQRNNNNGGNAAHWHGNNNTAHNDKPTHSATNWVKAQARGTDGLYYYQANDGKIYCNASGNPNDTVIDATYRIIEEKRPS